MEWSLHQDLIEIRFSFLLSSPRRFHTSPSKFHKSPRRFHKGGLTKAPRFHKGPILDKSSLGAIPFIPFRLGTCWNLQATCRGIPPFPAECGIPENDGMPMAGHRKVPFNAEIPFLEPTRQMETELNQYKIKNKTF